MIMKKVFRNKYIMYPLRSNTIILIIASGIDLSIWWIKNKKQKITSTQKQMRCDDAML